MKHGILQMAPLVLALLTATSAGADPGNRVEREEKQTVDAAGRTSLVIRNGSGRTVIVGKAGLDAVSIIAVKTVNGKDNDEAAEILDQLQVEIETHGDKVVIDTHEDRHGSHGLMSLVKGDRRSAWVDYTIEVPYAFSVDASASSGDVRISNIGGSVAATATSGNVSVRAVTGGVEARVTSGDLEVAEAGGDLEASATSGNITVDNVTGKLQLEATSGDARVSRIGKDAEVSLTSGNFTLDGCSGSVSFRAASGDGTIHEVTGNVDATSSSGNIEVMIVPSAGRIFELSSSSGDIDVLYVAVKDFGFKLDVQTSSGSIEGDLPIKVSRVDRRRLQGVVGSGAARVDIETASGNVSILERTESATR
ncbi:MAG TPA: DUF4097 family beta strand repeat-containing protein [Candidatus Krumholzibacteria bacterium]|nr:DUF4097 family beta strand repeat-containing protein [Candidatus Krumholzibacteria bacterium]